MLSTPNRPLALLPIVLLPVFFLGLSLSAIAQEASRWFQEERFLIADRDDDAHLDRSELTRFPEEFGYFLNSNHFELADANQDQMLSFREMAARWGTENRYRFQQERQQLLMLSRQFPLLSQADEHYLLENPDLVEALFGNFLWLLEHEVLTESISNNQAWTQKHPKVLLALHRNLRWMVVNPDLARQLYRTREVTQQLPELLSWRADHQDFIRSNRGGSVEYFEFVPDGIRLRR